MLAPYDPALSAAWALEIGVLVRQPAARDANLSWYYFCYQLTLD
jgi:hypothetical protein